ncbi:hypothetical protein TYRP_009597 [Tyrophagus putrescentiae]|nr:hypothetical protein TYRP_009597 [Tyrophagus putrescentiae]
MASTAELNSSLEASNKPTGSETVALEATTGNETVATEATPANETVALETTPGNETVATEVTPGNGTIATEATPGNGTVAFEPTPGSETVATEATSGNGTETPKPTPGNETEAPKLTIGKETEASDQTPGSETMALNPTPRSNGTALINGFDEIEELMEKLQGAINKLKSKINGTPETGNMETTEAKPILIETILKLTTIDRTTATDQPNAASTTKIVKPSTRMKQPNGSGRTVPTLDALTDEQIKTEPTTETISKELNTGTKQPNGSEQTAPALDTTTDMPIKTEPTNETTDVQPFLGGNENLNSIRSKYSTLNGNHTPGGGNQQFNCNRHFNRHQQINFNQHRSRNQHFNRHRPQANQFNSRSINRALRSPCVHCGDAEHSLPICTHLTSFERYTVAKENGLCYMCGTPGHRSNTCSSSRKCYKCGGGHHFFICPNALNKIHPKQPKYKRSSNRHRQNCNLPHFYGELLYNSSIAAEDWTTSLTVVKESSKDRNSSHLYTNGNGSHKLINNNNTVTSTRSNASREIEENLSICSSHTRSVSGESHNCPNDCNGHSQKRNRSASGEYHYCPTDCNGHNLVKDLTEFSGNPLDWEEFYSQFKKLVEDSDLDPLLKLGYLRRKVDAKTKRAIQNYSNEDYDKVIKFLKAKFTGPASILQSITDYVHDLPNHTSKQTLEETQEAIERLRSVSSLMTKHKVDKSFALEIMRAFNTKIPRRMADKYVKTLQGKMPSIPDYLAVLEPLIADLMAKPIYYPDLAQERRKQARQNRPSTSRRMNRTHDYYDYYNQPSTQYRPKNQRPSYYQTPDELSFPCFDCDSESHTLPFCPQLTPAERMQVARKHYLCYMCLEKGHRSFECEYDQPCHWCNQMHNELLCTGEADDEEEDYKDDENFTSDQCNAINDQDDQSDYNEQPEEDWYNSIYQPDYHHRGTEQSTRHRQTPVNYQ